MRSISYIFLAFFLVILLARYNTAEEKVRKNTGDDGMCSLDGGKEESSCGEDDGIDQEEDDVDKDKINAENEVGDATEEEREIKDGRENVEADKKGEKVFSVDRSKKSEEEMEEDLKQEQTLEQEYLKGSACSYCTYCKFCKLCDVDCPCETSAKKPNCGMCKYCKYCYLCKMGCDTICQPGGVIDRFTSYLSNRLPKFNKDEVDVDIEKVKNWIDNYKEEL